MSSQTTHPDDPFPLEKCTIADLPQMARIYHSAFASNPSQPLLFPLSLPYSTKEEWFINNAKPKFSQPELHFLKITDRSTGEMAGFARFGFPYKPVAVSPEEKEKKKSQIVVGWPEGTNLAFTEEKFGPLMAWRNKYVEWEEMYVVYILAVDPKYQRKGFATRLLRAALDRADAEGRKTYIEASPDGYHVYYKLGFRDIDRASAKLEDYGGPAGVEAISVCMMRDPVREGKQT